MLASIIKVKRITADANATLPAGTLVHGVICNASTLTSAASALVYDAATVTGNPVFEFHANTADATNYEKTFGGLFPYPVKFYTGVSVDVTNLAACYIFYS